jgi:phosphatidylglycerophosphate synthase
MAVGGQREMTFLLAAPEKRLLVAMAKRMPAAVNSDHLTALGVLGALGAGAAYYMTNRDPAWFWLASAMLVVNWFGDSLDGTVARVRKIERPRFGFYLDHAVDAFATVVIGAAVGLSPWVSFDVALVLVIAYLVLSINVYLEAQVFKRFQLSYGLLGPTEARILLILVNTALAVVVPRGAWSAESISRVADWVVGGAAALMALLFFARLWSNLVVLYREEPLPPRSSS